MATIETGMRIYDSLNGRYLEVDGVCSNPNCFSCIQEELNDDGELEVTSRVLLTKYEIEKIMRRG